MILSMTGFGEARTHHDDVAYRVEIRSLNNRYFKLVVRLPEQFQRYETEIDRQVRSRLRRGSVTYALRVIDEHAVAAFNINTAVLSHYVARLQEVAQGHDGARIDLATLLEIPGVCQPPDIPDARLDEQFGIVREATAEALDRLVEMRRTEGVALREDIEAHCAVIRSRLPEVEARAPLVVQDYAKRLHSRIRQLMADSTAELEKDSLAREVALHADRCDLSEEIARTRCHLDQFSELCKGPEEAGRKLEFLAQELLREANTIGSKANSAEIARHVVEIKASIDRIKEQVQNAA